MFKGVLGWIVFAVSVTVVAGGSYYYYTQHTTVNQLVVPPALIVEPPSVPPSSSVDDLNRKRKEGIGSIRDLKPVEIPPANTKPHK